MIHAGTEKTRLYVSGSEGLSGSRAGNSPLKNWVLTIDLSIMASIPPEILFGPSKKPPIGVVPNFTKRSPLLDLTIASSAVFLPLMYVFMGIRVYIRSGRRENWRLDDRKLLWHTVRRRSNSNCKSDVAVVTVVVITVLSGLLLSSAPKLAKHSWDIPLIDIISADPQKVIFIPFLGLLCQFLIRNRAWSYSTPSTAFRYSSARCAF